MAVQPVQEPLAPEQVKEKIRAVATEFGVDPDFAVGIATVENARFDPNAISRNAKGEVVGARGYMQVMPDTAKELATRYGDDNIRQGVGYLRELQDTFDAAPEPQRRYFVAAAYNAGPGRMLKLAEAIKARGGDPYNISEYADDLPEETLAYVTKLADAAPASAVRQLQRGATPTTPAARQPEGFGGAIMHSLASEGERQLEAVRGLAPAARRLVSPQGEATPADALRASRDMVLQALGAAAPLASPTMVGGGVTGETLARMGLIPLSPEQGATAGSLAAGAATLAPGAIRGTARLLSPSLRAVEGRVAARGAALGRQGQAVAGREAQLAERAGAGTRAQETTGAIAARLQKEADDLARASAAEQPGALRLQPQRAVPETSTRTTETITSPIVGPRGEPITRTEETIRQRYGRPERTLTERDYNAGFLELRRANERAAQAAIHFDRGVTARLERLGPRGVSKALATDADLSSAILAHATPEEAAIIQRAITAGRPLSKLPYTEAELAKIGSDIVAKRSRLLTPLTHMGLGGAGIGYFTGHPEALGYGAAVLVGRLGLKALDATLASKPSAALLRNLGRLQPGSADAARLLAGLGGELSGRQLQTSAR